MIQPQATNIYGKKEKEKEKKTREKKKQIFIVLRKIILYLQN